MKKTNIALTVVALASFSFAAWDGTSKNPASITRNDSVFYQITSPEELIGYLENIVNIDDIAVKKNAILKNDIVFGKDTASLSTKIWKISVDQKTFSSNFDGNGKTIYGLNAAQSLFENVSCVNDGIIKNLTIANSKIGSDTLHSAGGLAGEIRANTENIEVRNTEIRAKTNAGGIAGSFGFCSHDGQNPAAHYKNLRVIKGSVHAQNSVGGITGTTNLPIQDVLNTSDVYLIDTTSTECTLSSDIYAGGIVGRTLISYTSIGVANAINKGNITVKQKCNNAYAGGIAGHISSFIMSAHNEGNISIYTEGEMGSYAGGHCRRV